MKKTAVLLISLVIITSLNISVFADGKFKLPEITKDEAVEISSEYIKENFPQLTDEIDFNSGYTVSYSKNNPYGYNVRFIREINGIPYIDNDVDLFVDCIDGSILWCNVNFNENIVIETSGELISKNDARKKFRSALGLKLQYNKKFTDNSIETYLTYSPDTSFFINAITGNTISLPYSLPTDGYFDITHMSQKVSGSGIVETNILSISETDSIARNTVEFNLTDKYKITSANYLINKDGTYLITLEYKFSDSYKNVTLNATTGKIVEYETNEALILTNKDDSYGLAENFANKYYPEYMPYMVKSQYQNAEYTVVLYERTVNNIPYKSNGLYLCYDNYGNLKQVSFQWDNTEFDTINEIITEDEAYAEFFKKCDLELAYHTRDNNIVTPIYKMSSNGTGIIDAYDKKQLNYDGTRYISQREMNYIDINSHYAKDIAKKLSDCDIYVSSGNVFLSEYISQEDYLLLLTELIDGTKPVLNNTGVLTGGQREMLYTYMYAKDVLNESETNYYGYITRAEAVKYLINIIGYGTVGEMNDIFMPHFADTDSISKDSFGYISLARSMGIVVGDEYGNFNPNDFITNGDCLIMVYNYLKR